MKKTSNLILIITLAVASLLTIVAIVGGYIYATGLA